MTTTIRILIADDHAVVRTGLRALLASDPSIEVLADVSEASAAVERSRVGDVDVVLMDLRFAGDATAGVRATASLRELPDPPQVLVLTSHDTDADIVGAIEAGACSRTPGPTSSSARSTPRRPGRVRSPPPSRRLSWAGYATPSRP